MKNPTTTILNLLLFEQNKVTELDLEFFNIQPEDWDIFYKFVLRHRVWHQIYHIRQVLNLESSMQKKLTDHCAQDKLRIIRTAGETVRIARQFKMHHIEHCFVKGTVLNQYLYGGINTRSCRDIDVWVSLQHYEVAVDLLYALGYQQEYPIYEIKGFKKTYHFKNKHDIAFYHPERQILVELHFKLNYLTTHFFPFSAVTLKPIDLLGEPVLSLEDHYHFLYLIIHGAIHAWIRLRWLQDIALFIQNKQINLSKIFELAEQIQSVALVEQALILVFNLFKIQAVKPWIEQASLRGQKLANLASLFIQNDYEVSDALKNPKMFMTHRYYLFKLANPGKKIKAISSDFLKIDEVFPYVDFPKSLSFMYYMIYPLWVIRYVYRNTKKILLLRY